MTNKEYLATLRMHLAEIGLTPALVSDIVNKITQLINKDERIYADLIR